MQSKQKKINIKNKNKIRQTNKKTKQRDSQIEALSLKDNQESIEDKIKYISSWTENVVRSKLIGEVEENFI